MCGAPTPSPTPTPTPSPTLDLADVLGLRPSQEGVSVSSAPHSQGFAPLTESEIYKVVKDVNTSKSSGIDNISSLVLKEAFSILTTEMSYMFNLSLKSASFASQWKKALVVPIPKSGNLCNVQNYRPISLLPLPGKILEKLIHKQISSYLEDNSLLTDKQHGFRKSHSTVHSVAQLVGYVNDNLDSRKPTLATYIDFKK